MQDEPVQKEKQKFLKSDQIYDRLMSKLEDVNDLLSTSQDHSLLIFHYYRWNFEALQEKYFGEQDQVKKALGLLPAQLQLSTSKSKHLPSS